MNANEPAYPHSETIIQPIPTEQLANDDFMPEINTTHYKGLTKREHIAAQIMAGISSDDAANYCENNASRFAHMSDLMGYQAIAAGKAEMACVEADALIAKLSQP